MVEKKKEGEADTSKSPLTIRNEIEAKIKHALSKHHINQKEVYTITKEFFKEYLDLEYEFTHEELLEELQKIYLDKEHQKIISSFVTTIGLLEYTDKTFSQEELQLLFTQLQEIITLLIKHHSTTSWFDKVLLKIGINKQTQTSIEEEQLEKQQELFKLLRKVDDENNIEKAKELYSESLEYYNSLPKKDQKKYYDQLMNTYNKLQQVE